MAETKPEHVVLNKETNFVLDLNSYTDKDFNLYSP